MRFYRSTKTILEEMDAISKEIEASKGTEEQRRMQEAHYEALKAEYWESLTQRQLDAKEQSYLNSRWAH